VEILVDREIHRSEAAFAPFGHTRVFDGRNLTRASLGAAEILLVRSVTRVDEALLGGSAVRFVGTATSGIEHVDTDYLRNSNIQFADAGGCNARAVAEYVICCIYAFAAIHRRAVHELTVGVVGYGHVGSALVRCLARLNIRCKIHDPLVDQRQDGPSLGSLEEILACDVVTLHVPLTQNVPFATRHLIDQPKLALLRNSALLINAARGGVVDEDALCRHISVCPQTYVALDCWDGEPSPQPAMIEKAWRATPHIAGHTFEARRNACAELRRQLADFLNISRPDTPLEMPPRIDVHRGTLSEVAEILALLSPWHHDPRAMLALRHAGKSQRAADFDALRRRFGGRREFSGYVVARAGLDHDTVAQLDALGFAA
jgi:erythronate-4-phosphate dehydrogenase